MGVAFRKCVECRTRAVSATTLATYSTEMEHDGRTYQINISDFDVLKCEKCSTLVLDDAASDRLFEALRSKAGLLSASEIRKRRTNLGLTQKELAGLLAISESTLSRWETGAQIQQRSMDKLLRLFFEVEGVRRFLGMVPLPIATVTVRASELVVQDLDLSPQALGDLFPPARASWPVGISHTAMNNSPTDPDSRLAA